MSESTERVRVMRLIARLNVGGPAIHAALLTQRLDPQLFDSQLVTGVETAQEGNMLEHMQADKTRPPVRPLILPQLGREIAPHHDLRTLGQLVRLMRRNKPHIVHTHTAKAGFVGRLAARLARVPVIIHTFHGNVFQGYFSPAKTRLFIGIERYLARFTDRIIVLSEQQKQEIVDLGIGNSQQFNVIPLGLDLKPFLQAGELRGQLRRELGIAPDTPLIGIVARLVPIKAVNLFLAAASEILTRYPQALFLIVGDGELRAELEQQAQHLALTDSVRFLGFRSDLPKIYADLDCVVLCSLNEGLPVAIIEALTSARPVVATDVGSVGNLVTSGVTGLLVPPREASQLGQAIVSVLNDPVTASQWGQSGRERVYPALDIQRLIIDMEQLYLQTLKEKHVLGVPSKPGDSR